MKDAIDLVRNINDLSVNEVTGEYLNNDLIISLSTMGWEDYISMSEVILWNEENDERRYLGEEIDEYEPLKVYVTRRLKEYSNSLQVLVKKLEKECVEEKL